MKSPEAAQLIENNESLSNLDIHFARLMQRLANSDDPYLLIAAGMVSKATREGNICLDLNHVKSANRAEGHAAADIDFSTDSLITALRGHPEIVGAPEEFKPLILDPENRLYLYRYWRYQDDLVSFIQKRSRTSDEIHEVSSLQQTLSKYFPTKMTAEIDRQMLGVLTAVLKNFCVISGGPGTGKTYTVGKIIAVLLEQSESPELRVCLTAPTGKAAIRLQESIRRVKQGLPCPDNIKNAIPDEASTIHRLLGYKPNSPYFYYNAANPLAVDVMIVDEASMVDLALMAKLVHALPAHCKLILLGDNHQLASVEAGAVLGDICDARASDGYSRHFLAQIGLLTGWKPALPETGERGIQDCIVELKKSYRFESKRGIGLVSRAVNAGDGEAALQYLHDDSLPDASWLTLGTTNLFDSILTGFKDFFQCEDPQEKFRKLEAFRVLCAVRRGPHGVSAINRAVENHLRRTQNLAQGELNYPGRPIMITQNDYSVNLFNGNLGIILPVPELDGRLEAHFLDADGGIRRLRLFRLPEHETAYAITVHKSQGSEFQKVLLMIPELDTPVLTRELIYTGITRATDKVEIFGIPERFKEAVRRKIERTSGFRDALRRDPSGDRRSCAHHK